MRRLNPNLKRWFLWIGILALISYFCFAAPKLFKIIDPENEHHQIRKELESNLTVLGGCSLLAIHPVVFYGLALLADNIKAKGLSATVFFDPLLAEHNRKKAKGRPRWRFLLLPAGFFVGLSIVFV